MILLILVFTKFFCESLSRVLDGIHAHYMFFNKDDFGDIYAEMWGKVINRGPGYVHYHQQVFEENVPIFTLLHEMKKVRTKEFGNST